MVRIGLETRLRSKWISFLVRSKWRHRMKVYSLFIHSNRLISDRAHRNEINRNKVCHKMNSVVYSKYRIFAVFTYMKLFIPDIHRSSNGQMHPTEGWMLGWVCARGLCVKTVITFFVRIFILLVSPSLHRQSTHLTSKPIEHIFGFSGAHCIKMDKFMLKETKLHSQFHIRLSRTLHPLPLCHSCTFSAPENCFVAKKKHWIQRQALRKQLSMR